jgi:hypothetical protein
MCNLKPGQIQHTVVLRFTTNGEAVVLELGRKIEHVQEVRLAEYAIRNPNGGAVTPSLWKLHFHNQDFFPHETTNADGPDGAALVISDAAFTHRQYNEHPRVISKMTKGVVTKVQAALYDETGALATFDDATIFLDFVCVDPDWHADLPIIDDMKTPNFPSLQFDSRARFRPDLGL